MYWFIYHVCLCINLLTYPSIYLLLIAYWYLIFSNIYKFTICKLFILAMFTFYQGHPENNESCWISREPWHVAYWNFTILWYNHMHKIETKMNAIAWRHAVWRHSDWRHILDSVHGETSQFHSTVTVSRNIYWRLCQYVMNGNALVYLGNWLLIFFWRITCAFTLYGLITMFSGAQKVVFWDRSNGFLIIEPL